MNSFVPKVRWSHGTIEMCCPGPAKRLPRNSPRPADFGRYLDQDVQEIARVVPSAEDLRVSARSERRWLELKKLPDASRQARTAVPELFLERSKGELEARAVARVAPQTAARQAGPQPELSWRLENLWVAPEQPEPLQVARRWRRVSSQEWSAQLR